jgi:hypothetical protein
MAESFDFFQKKRVLTFFFGNSLPCSLSHTHIHQHGVATLVSTMSLALGGSTTAVGSAAAVGHRAQQRVDERRELELAVALWRSSRGLLQSEVHY